MPILRRSLLFFCAAMSIEAQEPIRMEHPENRPTETQGIDNALVQKGLDAFDSGNYELSYHILSQNPCNALVEFDLGAMNYFGNGTTKDLSAAAQWFQKSSDHGNMVGKRNLALMYLYGTGLEQNASKGLSLLEEVASCDNFEAQYSLGCFYDGYDDKGHETETNKNLIIALKWFMLASRHDNGNGNAHSFIGLLKPRMTRDQLHKSKMLVRQWLEDHAEGEKKLLHNKMLDQLHKQGSGEIGPNGQVIR